eukprot:g15887.t1
MPARLVYLKESEYKAFKSLITAKFCGTEINAAVFDPKKDSLGKQKMIDAPAQGVLDTAVADLTGALSCMETQLGKTKFIVGKEVSLADIALVCSLLDVFKLLLGASYRGNFPKLSAWFATCTQLPQFQAVLGSRIALCSSSNLNFAPLVRTLTRTPEELAALQAAKDRVRELKTAGAEKADVEAAVAEMKRLKEVCGEVDPPKKKKK